MNQAVAPEAPECQSLDWAHPFVQEWFVAKFGTPTEPQEHGWPHILARKNTLICAPTGSGKTLAAFLACIDALVRKALAGELQDQTEVLYVSPLKALGNDIQKNLDVPLGEILQLAQPARLLDAGDPHRRSNRRHSHRATASRCRNAHHTFWSLLPNRSTFCSPPERAGKSCAPFEPSSWTKFTPSQTTSADRISPFRSNALKRSDGATAPRGLAFPPRRSRSNWSANFSLAATGPRL